MSVPYVYYYNCYLAEHKLSFEYEFIKISMDAYDAMWQIRYPNLSCALGTNRKKYLDKVHRTVMSRTVFYMAKPFMWFFNAGCEMVNYSMKFN